jgi:hypothetical protein
VAFACVGYNVDLNRITILILFEQCDQWRSIMCKYRVYIKISAVQNCWHPLTCPRVQLSDTVSSDCDIRVDVLIRVASVGRVGQLNRNQIVDWKFKSFSDGNYLLTYLFTTTVLSHISYCRLLIFITNYGCTFTQCVEHLHWLGLLYSQRLICLGVTRLMEQPACKSCSLANVTIIFGTASLTISMRAGKSGTLRFAWWRASL